MQSSAKSPIQCPRCNIEMNERHRGAAGQILIDVCSSCGGAWFDRNELDQLDDSVWTSISDLHLHQVTPDHPGLMCPTCHTGLEALSPPEPSSRLVVDHCAACGGFWLDSGELEQIRELTMIADNEISERILAVKSSDDLAKLEWFAHRLSGYLPNL